MATALAAAVLGLAACKDRIAPHTMPEADPELLVAQAAEAPSRVTAPSAGVGRPSAGGAGAASVIALTVNNAPDANNPVEQELDQRFVEQFEKRNPGIRITFSPWQFTPETFFERAAAQSLTDIVEVDAAQIPLIIDASAAADLTDNAAAAPEMKTLNPELTKLVTRDGRVYGVPVEFRTMALFYNRKLVAAAALSDAAKPAAGSKNGKGTATDPAKPTPDSRPERRKGRGADAMPHGFDEDDMAVPVSAPMTAKAEPFVPAWLGRDLVDLSAASRLDGRVVAQYGYGYQYQQQPQGEPSDDSGGGRRRGGGQAQAYDAYGRPLRVYRGGGDGGYQTQPTPQPRRGLMNWFRPGQDLETAPPRTPAPRSDDGRSGGQQPEPVRRARTAPSDAEPGEAPVFRTSDDPGAVSADGSAIPEPTKKPRRRRGDGDGETSKTRPKSAIDEDVVSSDPDETSGEAKETTKPLADVETAGLPQDWGEFIKLAVKMTDHAKGQYGYAPVVFAKEGGREFTQWACQAGLRGQVTAGGAASLDINTTPAAEAARMLKDMQWRFDAMPPASQCYADNVRKMFAAGKVGMVMLPCDKATIEVLTRLGMAPEDLGIAPLPAGPVSRRHLAFGRVLVVNSQLDQARRAAAFKWLMFRLEPEQIRAREQAYFREKELTGIPRVPIFTGSKQTDLTRSLKPFFRMSVFKDYDLAVATAPLALEPPVLTDRFYESVALGVRPIVEQEAVEPTTAVAGIASDFETKYLKAATPEKGLKRVLEAFKKL